MPSTTTEPSVAVDERQAKINEYVLRSALSDLLWSIVRVTETPERMSHIAGELASELFGELWPEDEDLESREHIDASRRAAGIAGAMMVQLTTSEGQDGLKSEAAGRAYWAAEFEPDTGQRPS